MLAAAVGLLTTVAAHPLGQAPQAAAPAPAANSCNMTAAGRIVAVADVHGALDKYVAILREAQLIDNRRRWIGGKATFVQLGDVMDRGPASKEALDMLRRLETEAAAAGGQVKYLLGNHEVMIMASDLRYVSKQEYDAFKTPDSFDLREKWLDHAVTQAAAAAKARGAAFDAKGFKKDLTEDTPLGWVELQLAFSETGQYGAWLRTHDIMARINGIVFVHGGPGAEQAAVGCEGTNERARKDIKTVTVNTPNYLQSFLWNASGALWFRGLVSDPPDAVSDDEVTAVLKSLGATRMVVGHTVTGNGKIKTWHDNRIFQIDAGMLDGEFYPGGQPVALEIDNGTFTAIYLGKREVLVPGSPR